MLVLKGMAMGMAEVVPGVSGGTIAFITGIYSRLVNAIKRISALPIGIWRKQGFTALWQHIDGWFLVRLAAGMAIGILIGVFGISFLLHNYPTLIWGFFFGLIIGSVIYVGKQIRHWTWLEVLCLLVGALIAYYITVVSPAEGSRHLFFVFISGAIAICALILPGISGSFILLLMGMYTFVLESVKTLISTQSTTALLIVTVFAAGCLVGIMLFSNVLSWTLRKYESPTLALLTGFMVGSLNRIWPWRNPSLYLHDETGSYLEQLPPDAPVDAYHLVSEINVLPATYSGEPRLLGTLACFVLGLALVYAFSRMGGQHDESS